jgi:hypothetical protein
MIVAIGVLGFLLIFRFMIGRGKNWARIIYAFVLAAEGAVMLGITFLAPDASQTTNIGMLLHTAKDLVVVILLFWPETSAWFKAMKNQNRKAAES